MAAGMTVLMLRCVLVCIWLKPILAYEKCEKIDQCSCSTDEGEISLWGLAERGDRPRFADIPSNNGRYKSFSWNPCISYSVSKSRGRCRDVAACAQTMVYYYYAIAKQDTATCVLTSGQCALKYTMKSWSLTVTLKCDESLEGKVEKMNVQTFPSTAYDTVLHSYYACPKFPPAPPTLAPEPSSPSDTAPSKDSSSGDSAAGQSSGLSLGSKLIITFCCLSVAYIIFGTLINKYGRHMEGREAFPNYSFWSDLPHLMKDGGTLTFHSLGNVCGKASDGKGYTPV